MQRAVEKYYSVSETAWLLSFSNSWGREKISQGTFAGTVKIDDDFRIPASAINTFIDAHEMKFLDPSQMGIAARSDTELKRKISAQKFER